MKAASYDPGELLSWYLDIVEALLGNGRLAPKEREVLAALLADLQPRVATLQARAQAGQPLIRDYSELNHFIVFMNYLGGFGWKVTRQGYDQTGLMRAAKAARRAKAEAALQAALQAVYRPEIEQLGKAIGRAVNQKLIAQGFPAVSQRVIWARLRQLKLPSSSAH